MKPTRRAPADLPAHFSAYLLALCTGLILSACGGGGGGSSPAPAGSASSTQPAPVSTTPAPQPTVTISPDNASLTAGQTVTLSWSSQNTGAANCQASGAWSGQLATSGSQQVATATSASASSATYTITCGAAVGSTTVALAPTPVQNTMTVTVDSGTHNDALNVPFVTVTVCRPGTSVCQTIDHVMVDSGSYGLRLLNPLDSGLGLPAVTTASGAEAGECGQFVSGYTWGSVVQADIKLAGETALGQSIQLIGGAPGGVGTAPSSCSSVGGNIGTPSALGAKGVLGIGQFKQDCGAACVSSAVSATYYACSNGSCTASTMPLAKQIGNPVAAFATDNNGVVLSFPSIATGGASTLSGTLTFGIGTRANNALGGATVYAANLTGHFRTTYKGTVLSSSFIDSGSNGLFFNDSALQKCTLSTDFYCPPTPQTLSATIAAYDGSASTSVSFIIESVDALPGSAVTGWIGGPSGTSKSNANSFDWGLPFFFGRKVFIGMESSTATPYWAF